MSLRNWPGFGALADRMVRLVVPRVEAMAACSGCRNTKCACPQGRIYRCCYKASCEDSCVEVACCAC
jgi:hypothetical protein